MTLPVINFKELLTQQAVNSSIRKPIEVDGLLNPLAGDKKMTDEARVERNTNIKINTLFGLAALIVLACMAIVLLDEEINEFAKGVVTMVLSRFLGYMDNMYNFELGSATRSSMKKDDTISDLAKTTVPVAIIKDAKQ